MAKKSQRKRIGRKLKRSEGVGQNVVKGTASSNEKSYYQYQGSCSVSEVINISVDNDNNVIPVSEGEHCWSGIPSYSDDYVEVYSEIEIVSEECSFVIIEPVADQADLVSEVRTCDDYKKSHNEILIEDNKMEIQLVPDETDFVTEIQIFDDYEESHCEMPVEQNRMEIQLVLDEADFVSGKVTNTIMTNQKENDMIELHDDDVSLINHDKCDYNKKQQRKDKSQSSLTRQCCVDGCNVDGTDSLHTFPAVKILGKYDERNLDRCREWIKNSGNKELLKVPTANLHKRYFICSKHFKKDQFLNFTSRCLYIFAIPTEFSVPPLTEEDLSIFPILDLADELFSDLQKRKVSLANNDCCFEIDTVDDDTSSICKSGLDQYQCNFENQMKQLEWTECPKCKEVFLSKKKLKSGCIHNNSCANYTIVNDMDPGAQPDELKGLSMVEELLIARAHPLLSVYQVKFGQLKYSGNVITFPQHTEEIVRKLPHQVSGLKSILIVRAKKRDAPDVGPDNSSFYVNFHVRAKKVKEALSWLQANNPFYKNIEIDEENLFMLPEDGCVFNDINTIELSEDETLNLEQHVNNINETKCTKQEEEIHNDINIKQITSKHHTVSVEEGSNTENNSEESDIISSESGIPVIVLPNQNEQVRNVLDWPSIEKTPFNEFGTVGYIPLAFPTLYPKGVADLKSPRSKKINPSAYFKHMLRYHDRRFARHPTYRYFALNSLMRWTAINDGSMYVQKNSDLKNLTVDELKIRIKEDPNILRKVMFHCNNLRGTKPYWRSRSAELRNMIEQLGMPTVFITLSSADLHWPDLYRLLSPDKNVADLTETARKKLLIDNPSIADEFFSKRVEIYIQEVLSPKFTVEDYWYRVEYQHRGSPHIHGVFWFKDAPDVTNLKNMTAEETEKIVQYFDRIISSIHPNPSAFPAPTHPCRKHLHEVINFQEDIAELLNKVQRHTMCNENYCLRLNKKTGKKECRFKFPKDETSTSTIQFSEDEVEFIGRRNDPRLNKYNEYIILTWRANMDIAPVLSKQALINYLSKYISKSETNSKELQEVLNCSSDTNQGNKQAKSLIQRLYIHTCSERDYSAQEVCHLLLSEKLYSAGKREFVTVNFRNKHAEWNLVEEENKRGKSFIEKYLERSDKLKNHCLWDVAKNFRLPTEAKRRCSAIVQVFPNMEKLKNVDSEEYFKLQVLLFVPWRNLADFDDSLSWEQIFLLNKQNVEKYNPTCLLPVDTVSDETTLEPDEECLDLSSTQDEDLLTDWMIISKMGPNTEVEEVELGLREVDLNYDWESAYNKYHNDSNVSYLRDFIKVKKKQQDTSQSIPDEIENVVFTEEQSQVMELVQDQILCIQSNGKKKGPKRIIVQGKAGTGKSVLIKCLSRLIRTQLGSESLLLLAPTGVAAVNIKGATVHSKMHLPKSPSDFESLKGSSAREFCNAMENVKFIILDEFSMVGCNAMGMIEQRCRQAKCNEEDFGGLHVILFGDIKQLPPVLDLPLYTSKLPNLSVGIHGKLIIRNFEKCIFLSQVQRQLDERYKQVLDHISDGKVTDEDFVILQERFLDHVSTEERNLFKDVIKLFPIKSKVTDINHASIEHLTDPITGEPIPIARIAAHHNCSEATKGSTDDANGLTSILHLGIGAKVMCRSNLWTECGIVNGAMGTVLDIVYEKGCRAPHDFPVAVICTFDSYTGPYFNLDEDEKGIPIPAITASWTSKSGISCSRTQFPLTLAYSCSIHKSQGMTLKKDVVDIGLKEMATGLSYVALSRCTDLKGMLLYPFPKARLLSINKSKSLIERLKFEEEFLKTLK